MVLDLEKDVVLLPGSAVPEVQEALACHPGVEVPKSPGAAPAGLVSREAHAVPGEGPAWILVGAAPACPAFPEDLSFPEGRVQEVRLEDEVLSALEAGGPSSCLGEQDPGSPGGQEGLAFLWDSTPSEVPETQGPGSPEAQARLAWHKGEGAPAFPWYQVGPADLVYQEALGGPCDPADQEAPGGPCDPADQADPEHPCDLEGRTPPGGQVVLEAPEGHEVQDASASAGARAGPEAVAVPGVGPAAPVVP